MKPLRRSQRVSTGHSGQQNGPKDDHAQANGTKRKNTSDQTLEDIKYKRYCLTEKNLSRHQTEDRTRKSPLSSDAGSGRTKTTATTTTTDRRFGPDLVANGVVFEDSFTVAPDDYGELKTALAREQPLPASAQKSWLGIREAKLQMAMSELTLESKIVEAMLAPYELPLRYDRFRNDQWTEVDNEITAGMSDPKPDVTESYLWSAYPANTADEFEDLVPTQYGYAMPTFAMESKGAGDPEQAVKQAAYDGAVMTHTALAVEGQMGKGEDSLYMKTKAITITLTPHEICVYANHAVKDPSNGKIAYHQHRVEAIRYMTSEASWNAAHSIVRNAQLFALHLADARIRDVEEYFRAKAQRLEQLKAKQAKIQAAQQAKARASMMSSSQRVSSISATAPNRIFPRATDNASGHVPAKANKISPRPANIHSEVEHKYAGDRLSTTSGKQSTTGTKTASDNSCSTLSTTGRPPRGTGNRVGSNTKAFKASSIGDLLATIDKKAGTT